tara:strand:- start:567 stop:1019 length:453 start_codon:yes stop_codon:yes gene_type:complete
MTNTRPAGTQDERIDALLSQMRMLCTQIEAIGVEQQRLLDEDMLEEFVSSLNSRNPKIESLAQAGELVERYLDSDGVGVAQVQSARAQLAEMAVMVEVILKRDAEQHEVVEKRRGELSKQLSGVGTARNAMRAYGGGKRSPNPTLQDRKG